MITGDTPSGTRGSAMTAVDAQFHWMSAKIPSDQFLLYAFAGVPGNPDAAVAEVLHRARASPDLTARLRDDSAWAYPRWTTGHDVPAVVRHDLEDATWAGCLAAIARQTSAQLDVRRTPWRLHLFTPVHQVPGCSGEATVAVVQVAHALADGARASALAAWLFGRAEPVAPVPDSRRGFLPWRAMAAARAHRALIRDVHSGSVPEPLGDRPLVPTNRRPAGDPLLRTLVRPRHAMPGPTITVGALATISTALADSLHDAVGNPEDLDELGAEVPMAKPGPRRARNHFGNVRVGLYPRLPRTDRIERIAADIAAGRARTAHAAARTADAAFAAVPAALLRWGVGRFDADARPNRVGGNTVVSSVNRGARDLSFGGRPVLLTAGFPALSPAMGLTHGVHGIGETVVLSVHTTTSIRDVLDVETYLDRLAAALDYRGCHA